MIAWLFGFFIGNWILWLPAIIFLAVGILLKDPKLIVFGVIAMLAVGYVGTLRGDLAAAVNRAESAEAAEEKWEASSEKQNLAVEGWKAAAVQNAAMARAAEKRARVRAAEIPAATAVTLTENIPAKSAEPTCEESLQWLTTPDRLSRYRW